MMIYWSYCIVGTSPLQDFIYTKYLKYIAQICRRDNSHPTKQLLFIEPTAKYVRDLWIKIQKLLNVDKDQIIENLVKITKHWKNYSNRTLVIN